MTDQIVEMIGIAVLVGLGISFTVLLFVLRPKLGAMPTVPPAPPKLAEPASIKKSLGGESLIECMETFERIFRSHIRVWYVSGSWTAEAIDGDGNPLEFEFRNGKKEPLRGESRRSPFDAIDFFESPIYCS